MINIKDDFLRHIWLKNFYAFIFPQFSLTRLKMVWGKGRLNQWTTLFKIRFVDLSAQGWSIIKIQAMKRILGRNFWQRHTHTHTNIITLLENHQKRSHIMISKYCAVLWFCSRDPFQFSLPSLVFYEHPWIPELSQEFKHFFAPGKKKSSRSLSYRYFLECTSSTYCRVR